MQTYTQFSATDRPQWRQSKTAGDTGEILIASLFQAIGLLVKRHDGPAATDLTIRGEIEVKHDRQAARTGCIACEVTYHGLPSGVTNSTASGWAFLYGRTVLLCRTDRLRELIRRHEYRRVNAGEHAVCLLVPVADVVAIGKRFSITRGGR